MRPVTRNGKDCMVVQIMIGGCKSNPPLMVDGSSAVLHYPTTAATWKDCPTTVAETPGFSKLMTMAILNGKLKSEIQVWNYTPASVQPTKATLLFHAIPALTQTAP